MSRKKPTNSEILERLKNILIQSINQDNATNYDFSADEREALRAIGLTKEKIGLSDKADINSFCKQIDEAQKIHTQNGSDSTSLASSASSQSSSGEPSSPDSSTSSVSSSGNSEPSSPPASSASSESSGAQPDNKKEMDAQINRLSEIYDKLGLVNESTRQKEIKTSIEDYATNVSKNPYTEKSFETIIKSIQKDLPYLNTQNNSSTNQQQAEQQRQQQQQEQRQQQPAKKTNGNTSSSPKKTRRSKKKKKQPMKQPIDPAQEAGEAKARRKERINEAFITNHNLSSSELNKHSSKSNEGTAKHTNSTYTINKTQTRIKNISNATMNRVNSNPGNLSTEKQTAFSEIMAAINTYALLATDADADHLKKNIKQLLETAAKLDIATKCGGTISSVVNAIARPFIGSRTELSKAFANGANQIQSSSLFSCLLCNSSSQQDDKLSLKINYRKINKSINTNKTGTNFDETKLSDIRPMSRG